MKLIDKLRFNADANVMTVLTPAEAQQIYNYIDDLHNRCEVKEIKFIAMCDETYRMVQLNRELKRRLNEYGQTTEEP